MKNAYLTSERSITRKIKEAVLAVKLERELDKDEILERYLNTIYFGRGAYGVGAASRAYFGKDVREIGVPEASYLAGLIRSPGSADAQDDPTEAARRRGTVLAAMRQEGYITTDQEALVGAMGWDYVIPRRDRRELQLSDAWQGHRRGVLHRGGAPAGRREVRRGHALRRRPADLHDPRPRPAGGGLGRGHEHARRARRPRRRAGGRRRVRPGQGHDGRHRHRDPARQPGPRAAGRRFGPPGRVRRSSRSCWPRPSTRGSR